MHTPEPSRGLPAHPDWCAGARPARCAGTRTVRAHRSPQRGDARRTASCRLRTRRLFIALCLGLASTAQAQDLATVALVRPTSGAALSSTEAVEIRLFNFGPALPAGSGFSVGYAIDSGAPVVEAVVLDASLAANATRNVLFSTPADLSVPGTYAFVVTVSLPGDLNPTNDTLGPVSVQHLVDILFVDGFEPD